MRLRVSSDLKEFLGELALASAFTVGLIALCLYLASLLPEAPQIVAYKSACAQVGGYPVHDGKQWQCLKEIK